MHLDAGAMEGSFGAVLNAAAAKGIALPAGTVRNVVKGELSRAHKYGNRDGDGASK